MFGRSQWLFAIKLYIAAMIAFTISATIGLPQTYWAVVTCCVVMNPMSGAIRSKAVYRFTGTLCAGVLSILLASMFGSVPILLIVGAGLVGAAAFGCSLLDRTPRGYGFQLFGLTLMIVAVAGVDHPEAMFDTAVARLSEIGLGIICCTVVDSVIAPRSLGPTVRQRLHAWLPDIKAWMSDAFQGRVDDAKAAHDRLAIIADITALSALAGQLRYDPLVTRRERQLTFAIQERLLRLVPMLSAIASRLADADEREREAVTVLLAEASDRADAGEPAYQGLAEKMEAARSGLGPLSVWRHLVHENLAELAADALRLWVEVRQIDAGLEHQGTFSPELEQSVQQVQPFTLQPDLHLAGRVAAGVLLAYSVLCGFWWATGWHMGANAVLLGVVALAFFGSVDQADMAIANFGRFAVLAMVLAGVLSYGLLPLARDFPTFLVVMALFMLPLAAWAATNPLAILLMALALSTINLQGQYSPLDFGTFLDACLASLLGIFAAFSCVSFAREMGVTPVLTRFVRRGRGEVVRLTYRATRKDRDNYINRSLDRIASMATRLAVSGEADQNARLLARLRAGANVAELRRVTTELDGEVREVSEDLLAAVRREIGARQPSPALLAGIDATLSAAWKTGARSSMHPLVRTLVGLRLALFEYAPAWEPAS